MSRSSLPSLIYAREGAQLILLPSSTSTTGSDASGGTLYCIGGKLAGVTPYAAPERAASTSIERLIIGDHSMMNQSSGGTRKVVDKTNKLDLGEVSTETITPPSVDKWQIVTDWNG